MAKDYITGKTFPKEYEGFPTERLLKLLNMRLSNQSLEGTPINEMRAMNNLDREYRLSPIFKTKK